jgi:hypothetical protein
MKKRIVDLRFGNKPLLDVVSYGKGAPVLTPANPLHIALTVHRVPEVMVKVSGGARTLGGVGMHFSYIGREGDLGLEMDTGARIDGKGFEQTLISDWDRNRVVPTALSSRASRGDTVRRCARDLPRRLALFADARGGQTEAAPVDFVGHGALVNGLADGRIQPFQQIREVLALASHQACQERLIIDGDGRTFDGRHPSDADVTTSLIQQLSDVGPLICLYRVSHNVCRTARPGCSGGFAHFKFRQRR